MAKSKKLVKKMAAAAASSPLPPRDAGTPETRRRLRQDQVAKLLEQGKLTRHHYDAADEIRTALTVLMRSIMPSRSMTERVDGGRHTGTPIDGWSATEERIIRRRYGPWSKVMQQPLSVTLHGRAYTVSRPLDIALDVIWENRGTRQTDDEKKLARGLTAIVVREVLETYVVMAGWRSPPPDRPFTRTSRASVGTRLDAYAPRAASVRHHHRIAP